MKVRELVELLQTEDPDAEVARWEEELDDEGRIVSFEAFERVWVKPIAGARNFYWLDWPEPDLRPAIVL
jgi:hypothetical protein